MGAGSIAISEGIKSTNVEKDQWYEYALITQRTVEVHVAKDAEAGLVFIKLKSEKEIEMKAKIAIAIFQEYTVK
jgi:hypothetical protein